VTFEHGFSFVRTRGFTGLPLQVARLRDVLGTHAALDGGNLSGQDLNLICALLTHFRHAEYFYRIPPGVTPQAGVLTTPPLNGL